MREPSRNQRSRKRVGKIVTGIWRGWIRPILTVVIVLGAFRSTIADWYSVPTGSMKPTILEGDRIVVNKLAYDLQAPFFGWQIIQWSEPQRGEIVICYSPEDGTRLVKRLVGLPGDRIELRDNHLIINGDKVSYAPLSAEIINQISGDERPSHGFASERLGQHPHAIMTTPAIPARRTVSPFTVPEGHYLVLGDNRDLSRDSRWFGFVPRNKIAGRVFGIALSLDREHW